MDLINKEHHSYMWVPVEMSLFTLREKFYQPLRLYLYLAFTTSGMSSFDKGVKEQAADYLGCSKRTIFRQIKPLLQRNWIGKNPDTGTHFIRGFEAVRNIEGFYGTTATKLYPKTLKEIESIRGFCAGSVIYNQILKKQREEERLNKNCDVHSRTLDLPPNSMFCAAKYLGKIIEKSGPTGHRLKQDAENSGHIKITENRSIIGHYDFMGIMNLEKYIQTESNFIKITQGGKYYEHVQPDIVTSSMRCRFRRSID